VEFSDISDPIPAAGLGNNRTIEQQFASKQRPCGLAQAAWRESWIYLGTTGVGLSVVSRSII
jgi:hypothetical protein